MSLRQSNEYQSFRASIVQKKVVVDGSSELFWTVYDYGPRDVFCPVIFLPPASGTGDMFFRLLMSLGSDNTRAIAVDYPGVSKLADWTKAFVQLLDSLRLDQVHLFGVGLGGYLAQKFAQATITTQRVKSIIMCNSYCDSTKIPSMPSSFSLALMPGFMMKRALCQGFPTDALQKDIADSLDFVAERLDDVERSSLSCRIQLRSQPGYVEPQVIFSQNIRVMIMYALDDFVFGGKVQDDVMKCYPEAKTAVLKTGGHFVMLSNSDEVLVFLRVHLREFAGTRYTASSSKPTTK